MAAGDFKLDTDGSLILQSDGSASVENTGDCCCDIEVDCGELWPDDLASSYTVDFDLVGDLQPSDCCSVDDSYTVTVTWSVANSRYEGTIPRTGDCSFAGGDVIMSCNAETCGVTSPTPPAWKVAVNTLTYETGSCSGSPLTCGFTTHKGGDYPTGSYVVCNSSATSCVKFGQPFLENVVVT